MVGIRATEQAIALETVAASFRAACLTLSAAAPDVMNAITVSQPLPAGESAREGLDEFVARVAGELGLFAVLETSETHVAVRLARATSIAEPDEGHPSTNGAAEGESDGAVHREDRSLWQRVRFATRDRVNS